MTASAFPLDWPAGWPRTPKNERQDGKYKYRTGSGFLTMARAQQGLYEELERLGATTLVVSSNLARRLDGGIRSRQATPEDPGVAIYFDLNDKPMSMAMDDFNEPECNVRRLALAIKAMRDLERNGGGTMMERAFSGFSALPAPVQMGEHWSVTLNVPMDCTENEAKASYRRMARQYHPDRPEANEDDLVKMQAINIAWKQVQEHFNGKSS